MSGDVDRLRVAIVPPNPEPRGRRPDASIDIIGIPTIAALKAAGATDIAVVDTDFSETANRIAGKHSVKCSAANSG